MLSCVSPFSRFGERTSNAQLYRTYARKHAKVKFWSLLDGNDRDGLELGIMPVEHSNS